MLRRHGFLLGLFLLLSLIATWPLIRHITTFVPGSDTWAYDEYTFIWSMWWFKHSLLDRHSTPFYSPAIFYPLGMELLLYSYNLLAAILALPLGVAVGWPFASNLTLLYNIVVSAWGAYWLALWLLRGRPGARWAALIAGIVFAFSSNRGVYLALGHYNIQNIHFLPFFVLYLLRLVERPTRRDSILTALFAAWGLLVDVQFAVFMAFLALCLLLARPWRDLLFHPWPDRERWQALFMAALLAVVFTFPYLWPTVRAFLAADYLLRGWGDALNLSADLVGWFTPTALHPLWGPNWPAYLRAVQEGTAPFRDVNTVFLGYATAALALIGAVILWRRQRGWVAAAGLAAVFTLGPLLQVRGRYVFDFDGLQTSIPLPFLLLHYLPLVKGNRVANRWSLVLILALAILAAWAVAWLWSCARRWRRRTRLAQGLVVVLAGVILGEHAVIPLPLTDARIPAVIRTLAAQPEGAVLPIPMGWRNSFGVLGFEDTRAQYYMTAHGKPILSGNTSRNPSIKFAYFARLPLVQAITRQEAGHPPDAETLAAARAQVEALLALWGVRYLLLLPPTPGRLPYADTWQASQQLALDLIPHDPEPLHADASGRLFAVRPSAPLPLLLDFGDADTAAWRGEGWGEDEADVGGAAGIWATAPEALLLFRSEDTTPRRLTFRAVPFSWPGGPSQRLRVVLNGQTVGEVGMSPDWQEYGFVLAPRPGINHLRFRFGHVAVPRQVLSQALIGKTGVQAPVDIEVHSFAEAYITLTDATGTQLPASFGRRGYNVTVLDRRRGRVLAQRGFDTVANPYEVERLVAYLRSLPPGRLVILATREGAGTFVSAELIAALRGLGSGLTTPAELNGYAHALVGIVGAAPGTAAEVLDPNDAFLRIAGDFRSLAAAFDWLRIE